MPAPERGLPREGWGVVMAVALGTPPMAGNSLPGNVCVGPCPSQPMSFCPGRLSFCCKTLTLSQGFSFGFVGMAGFRGGAGSVGRLEAGRRPGPLPRPAAPDSYSTRVPQILFLASASSASTREASCRAKPALPRLAVSWSRRWGREGT